MKKVLITGGAGYLGSLISTIFIKKGFIVTALDNLMHKKKTLNHLLNNKNFKFINDDVRNLSIYSDLISKNDIVFPLAGVVGAPLCDKN